MIFLAINIFDFQKVDRETDHSAYSPKISVLIILRIPETIHKGRFQARSVQRHSILKYESIFVLG